MAAVKIFIGGPSQSGKTTTARMVCDRLGFDHVDMDKDPETIEIKKKFVTSEKRERLKLRAFEIIKTVGSDTVIEGSQLWPADMRVIAKSEDLFYCVFCGYPNAEASEKLKSIADSEYRNARHLSVLSDQGKLSRIEKYIEISRQMKVECQDHAILFSDYSDMSTIDRDQRELAERVAAAVIGGGPCR